MSRSVEDRVALRPLAAEDWPATVDMWVAAWREAYPHIDFDARRPWFTEHVEALQGDGAQAIVAVREDAIVGLLIVHPETGDLDQLVVATEAQGSGLAVRLLDEARRLSPSRLQLHVNQDNARAIGFYDKQGFAYAGADVNPRSGAPTFRMVWRP